MRRRRSTEALICLLAAVIVVGGCGGGPSATGPPNEEPPPHRPDSVTLGESVIRVASPSGDWKFEAWSDRAEATTMEGPYVLSPMEGRYEHKDRPPVLMRADRAEVDKAEGRVKLDGSVWVASGAAQLEADRVEYDLRTGKVVAEGRQKWTLGAEADREGDRPTQEVLAP